MTDGPLPRWRRQVDAGAIRFDAAQEHAAERLQVLHEALRGYRPASSGAGWRRWLGLAAAASPAARGIYLLGDVGRGKSLLLDLFHDEAPVAAKRRVHFHAFMLEIHERLHRLRQAQSDAPDLIQRLAEEIAKSAWLLCFDELQVDNIVDAMLLGRLFAALFHHGAVVVATSNTAPDQLYEGGLQRELFLPFIDLINSHLELVRVDGPHDYRLDRLQDLRVYHTPLGASAERALADIFAALTDGDSPQTAVLEVQGRVLEVPRSARGVAWFDFADLCTRARGAADYIALARRYPTMMVSNIPCFDGDALDAALRLVTLIDALYEQRAKLICSAAESPDGLFTLAPRAEFRRAVSRLHEMQSADYLAEAHRR